ncbi:hypothetical protein ES319_D07G162300v1 [Gossypium barbadense]|uniref:Uncharacterized protein n=2 Tax=Gossypium TaxID=3633 RepID=A0A5J5QUW1_GOSBA|nr:hypothetical protein ES319_D07G162300v1 [Gossypium barbadense]TYG61739.1 hypothetical protein ES288_D07G173000v1 [Gossypium darwinii]
MLFLIFLTTSINASGIITMLRLKDLQPPQAWLALQYPFEPSRPSCRLIVAFMYKLFNIVLVRTYYSINLS